MRVGWLMVSMLGCLLVVPSATATIPCMAGCKDPPEARPCPIDVGIDPVPGVHVLLADKTESLIRQTIGFAPHGTFPDGLPSISHELLAAGPDGPFHQTVDSPQAPVPTQEPPEESQDGSASVQVFTFDQPLEVPGSENMDTLVLWADVSLSPIEAWIGASFSCKIFVDATQICVAIYFLGGNLLDITGCDL